MLLPDRVDDVDVYTAYATPPVSAGAHVRVNFVASADGAVTAGGVSGGLSGDADHAVFLALRDLCDVVLIGAGTVRVEGYGPARPNAQRRARREAAGLAPVPPIAVVSHSLDLDPSAPLFAEAAVPTIVLCPPTSPADRRTDLEKVADVIVAATPREWVDALVGRGLRRVLCEGGPTVFGQLLGDGCVDELCLTVSPMLGPSRSGRIVAGGPELTGRMRLGHLLEADDYLFTRYQVLREGRP